MDRWRSLSSRVSVSGPTAERQGFSRCSCVPGVVCALVAAFATSCGCPCQVDDRQESSGSAAAFLPDDAASTFVALAASCDNHDAEACFHLGRRLLLGECLPIHRHGAMAVLARACDQGHTNACYLVGSSYWADREHEHARECLQTACADGHPDACGELSALLSGIDGYPPDPESSARYWNQSLDLYRQRCSSGDGDRCAALALIIERSEQVPNRREEAKQLFSQGCAEGSRTACIELALREARPPAQLGPTEAGLPPDAPTFLRVPARLCDLGELTSGCAEVSTFFSFGWRARLYEDYVDALRTRMRELGYNRSCTEAEIQPAGSGNPSPGVPPLQSRRTP